ncbi:hypothetical protein ScalyP_jg11878 [Parmales sp. scaly parma]|nr:hypothetical protein ScalyP_jg11878 [Parmales sp. scaly parma]
MMKFTIASILLATAAAAPLGHQLDASYSYKQYAADFGKILTSEAEQNFNKNLAAILEHNKEGSGSWTMGVNHMTDEIAPKGRKATSKEGLVGASEFPHELRKDVGDLPAEWDWRNKGVMSPVKNQGHCGSCWAFATTATVESHVAIETGLLFELSEQQLVSCAPNEDHCGGLGGCMGSIPELAYDYLIGAGGYAEEWSYPYISYQGDTNGTCAEAPELKAGIGGYVKLPENDAASVMSALVNVGPLAINVDASTWHNYEGGVFEGCSFDEDMDLDHVVVLVGYGTDDKLGNYWTVRNSWSPTWGEEGYIRLRRDPVDSTPCGVDPTPQDGTGCDGDGTQYPCGQCGVVFDVSYPTGTFIV